MVDGGWYKLEYKDIVVDFVRSDNSTLVGPIRMKCLLSRYRRIVYMIRSSVIFPKEHLR